MTRKRLVATALAAIMLLSVFAMGAGMAATTTTESDWSDTETTEEDIVDNVVVDFNADADQTTTVIVETEQDFDADALDDADVTLEDWDTLDLEIEYENATHLETVALDDADADISLTDTTGEVPAEATFEFDHDELETLPGEPTASTIADVTVTEAFEDAGHADADDEDMVTVETEFLTEFEFSDERSVTYVHDGAIDDADVGPTVESEERELGTLASLNVFADEPEHDAYEIDDDRTLTENATHTTYFDGDAADAFEATAEDRDDGAAIYEMTQLADDEVVVVFNEEMDSDWLDADEDAYAVYDADSDSVTVYNLADSDEEMDLFGANDNPSDFVETGDVVSAFDDEFGFMGMFSAFGATAAGMSLTGIGLSVGALAGLFVVGRRRIAA